MSAELIVIEGYTLGIRTLGATGVISINPGEVFLSDVAKIEGNKLLYSSPFAVTGYVGGGVASGTGTGVLVAGSHKTKVKALSVMTEEDSVNVLITDSLPPFGTTTAEVGASNAGQLAVRSI